MLLRVVTSEKVDLNPTIEARGLDNSVLESALGTGAGDMPSAFVLHGNHPNPFNPSTTIAFDLPRDTHVRIDVFSVRGTKVATLTDRSYGAGKQSVTWNAQGVASGVYFYRVQAGNETSMQKMTLLK